MYFSAAKFSSTLTTEESIQKGYMKGKSKFPSHFTETSIYFPYFRSICPQCGKTFTKLKDHMKAVHNIADIDMTSLKTINPLNVDNKN